MTGTRIVPSSYEEQTRIRMRVLYIDWVLVYRSQIPVLLTSLVL
jgi:hypothetical protein